MLKNDVLNSLTTPLVGNAYPKSRYKFTNREYLNIHYKTDLEALKKIVPEPLEVKEPVVKFELMSMPDVSGLGSYLECGQLISVTFNGEDGYYLNNMYLNNVPAISVGREISGFPKKFGSPKLYVDSDTLVGTLDYGTLRVATATMGYKHFKLDSEKARKELCAPNFMLKIIPGYDGSPVICDLIKTQIKDITIKEAWSGPARLDLFAHALAPMSDLPVLEILSASHIITDLYLGQGTPIYNYLDN